MAWHWRALVVSTWFGVACGGGSSTDDGGPSSGADDDTGSDPDSDDDAASVEGSSSSGGSVADTGSTGPAETGADSTSSSAGSSSDDGGSSSTGASLEDCDVFAQDCPEGMKCAAWANDGGGVWNDAHCVPVADDPVQVGEPCTALEDGTSGLDDCEAGAMCWGVDLDTLMGTCVALCTGTADDPMCADEAASCAISNDGFLNLCLPVCNPLGDDCADGEGCYPVGGTFQCAVDASGGSGAQNDACMFLNGCEPGFGCLNPDVVTGCEDVGCCSAFCDIGDPTECTDLVGMSCIRWYEEGQAPAGLESLGVCADL
jgi:hypothetical protein